MIVALEVVLAITSLLLVVLVLLHKGNVWYELHGWSPKYHPQELKHEIARRLQAKAAELVKRIDAGEKLEDIAKAEGGLEVKNVNDATRVEASKLPAGVSARVFAVPIGKAGSADPSFYAFYRSLEAYRASFNKKSDVMVVDPAGSDFFKAFRGSGSAGAAAPAKK
mgnify:CR=1 FL=1